MGSSVYSRTPFMGPSAAALNAAFTSSRVTSLFSVQTKSVIDPVGVGTLYEFPFSFPLSSGMTTPMAFAAPVDVGMMFSAAARERRRSLCGRSRMR